MVAIPKATIITKLFPSEIPSENDRGTFYKNNCNDSVIEYKYITLIRVLLLTFYNV